MMDQKRQTIGVILRDPGQRLYREIKEGLEGGQKLIMKTEKVVIYNLTMDTNTCDSRMGADHTPAQAGLFKTAEGARAEVVKRATKVPPLSKWHKHSTGVLSWESWSIAPVELKD